MDSLGLAQIVLLMLALIAFFYLATRLKRIMLPALVLIGTGFALFMIDLILRSIFGAGLGLASFSGLSRCVSFCVSAAEGDGAGVAFFSGGSDGVVFSVIASLSSLPQTIARGYSTVTNASFQ